MPPCGARHGTPGRHRLVQARAPSATPHAGCPRSPHHRSDRRPPVAWAARSSDASSRQASASPVTNETSSAWCRSASSMGTGRSSRRGRGPRHGDRRLGPGRRRAARRARPPAQQRRPDERARAPLARARRQVRLPLLAVNVSGTADVERAFLPAMIERGRGVDVNVSSGWGRVSAPEVGPYCTRRIGAKKGLRQRWRRPAGP